MGEVLKDYDPYAEMHAFYRRDDPTEDEQFRFVEAMEYLIRTAWDPTDKIAMSFNLAMYYRDIKNFPLEKKYMEIGAALGEPVSKEQLGILWYYGLCGEQDFERAFHYFEDSRTKCSLYMIADMYRYGYYVARDLKRCREIIEDLFAGVESERGDFRFAVSTPFPEIALRLVQIDLEEGADTEFDLDCLFDARDILAIRQKHRPFWGNIKTMHSVLKTTGEMCGYNYEFIDLYDLLTFEAKNAVVTFDYGVTNHTLKIFENDGEVVYQFYQKWFHGAEEFLEKARISRNRITTVNEQISNISVTQASNDSRLL